MRRFYQQHSGYGPGGRNCTCCGPGPNERKVFDRMVKSRVRQQERKEIEREIEAWKST